MIPKEEFKKLREEAEGKTTDNNNYTKLEGCGEFYNDNNVGRFCHKEKLCPKCKTRLEEAKE